MTKLRACVLVALVGCGGGHGDGDEELKGILGLGDSIMAWNLEEGMSIPKIAGEELGSNVVNRAISGSFWTTDDGDAIPDQYVEGEWEWVIVDGGGNDVNDECACGDCEENIDGLVNEDGTAGEAVDFIEQVLDDGVKVALMSYYPMPEDAEFGFALCNEEVVMLRDRYQALADRHDQLLLVDAAEVVTPESTPQAYDEDRVHPSQEGSRIIGEYFAEQMAAHDEN